MCENYLLALVLLFQIYFQVVRECIKIALLRFAAGEQDLDDGDEDWTPKPVSEMTADCIVRVHEWVLECANIRCF